MQQQHKEEQYTPSLEGTEKVCHIEQMVQKARKAAKARAKEKTA